MAFETRQSGDRQLIRVGNTWINASPTASDRTRAEMGLGPSSLASNLDRGRWDANPSLQETQRRNQGRMPGDPRTSFGDVESGNLPGGPQPATGNSAANPIENINIDINTQLDDLTFPGDASGQTDIFSGFDSLSFPESSLSSPASTFNQPAYVQSNSFLSGLSGILSGAMDGIDSRRDPDWLSGGLGGGFSSLQPNRMIPSGTRRGSFLGTTQERLW